MQNSVAPVAAVSTAACTSDGMSSQAARTGEGNRPDCEQKWQSSGQPPVFTETMPSTSTSGPHQRSRTSWASASRSGSVVVGQPQHLEHLRLVEAAPLVEHLGRGRSRGSSRASVGGRHAGSLPHRRCRPGRGPARPGRRAGTPAPSSAPAPAGSAPASGRAASVSRSRTLLRQARSGSAGQAPITTPARPQAAVRHRLEGQRGVVEGAERRVDDDEHVGAEVARQVGDRRALLVVPDEQPAGALDERPGRGRRPARGPVGAPSRRSSGGRPAAPGGGGGGERVGEPRVARAGR